MSAAKIAAALGDERKVGRDVKCRCPLCGGRLSLRDAERGLLAKCWGGCVARGLYAELRRLGYLTGDPPPLSHEAIALRDAAAESARQRKIADALELWNEGHPLVGTLADRYLQSRGIDHESPFVGAAAADVLRFHWRCWYSPGIFRPALLAKIEHSELGFVGVSRTYLAPDGSGKTTLYPARKFLGCIKSGAVRLGIVQRDQWLIVAEGVETTLSVMQSRALPGWAALSADGIASLVLPSEASMVVICADNDINGTGQGAARDAALRFLAEGRRVKITMPPQPGTDWNDVLIGRAPGRAVEATYVA